METLQPGSCSNQATILGLARLDAWRFVSFNSYMQTPRLQELMSPPGNRLEALRGDRKGQYSIRINDQWRICFRWQDGDAFDVEIVDYH